MSKNHKYIVMKTFRIIVLSLLGVVLLTVSGFTTKTPYMTSSCSVQIQKNLMMNFFVTHGHCSTPFAGKIDQITVETMKRDDFGNELEGMEIAFEVDPNTFNVCRGESLTEKIKTPGLFIGENNEKITFKSTNVYTMGMDWYQVNGKLSIKGVAKDVKLFATGIRDSQQNVTYQLVIEGRFNLLDWGIDYDKIVNGESNNQPTKWLFLNTIVELC